MTTKTKKIKTCKIKNCKKFVYAVCDLCKSHLQTKIKAVNKRIECSSPAEDGILAAKQDVRDYYASLEPWERELLK